MKTKKAASLAFMLGLFSCGQSPAIPNPARFCSLPENGWRDLTFDTPNRVLVLTIRVENNGLSLNGRPSNREGILRVLSSSRSLRASPYAILEFNDEADCQNLIALSREINRVFNCGTNYCFFRKL